MANSHVSYSSAVIGRDQVNKQVIRWLWKSVPEIAEERLAVPSEQQLKDIWQAQYGQVCPGKGSVCLGTGFSLPELTVLLEGSDLFLAGFPFEKPVSLEDMKGLTAKEYLDKCTWHVHLKVGHGLLLPPNHVFMVLNPESIASHTSKMYVINNTTANWAMKALETLIEAAPDLKNKRSGLLQAHFKALSM